MLIDPLQTNQSNINSVCASQSGHCQQTQKARSWPLLPQNWIRTEIFMTKQRRIRSRGGDRVLLVDQLSNCSGGCLVEISEQKLFTKEPFTVWQRVCFYRLEWVSDGDIKGGEQMLHRGKHHSVLPLFPPLFCSFFGYILLQSNSKLPLFFHVCGNASCHQSSVWPG